MTCSLKKWEDNYDEFSKYLDEIHEEKDKPDPDYSVLLYASHKLNALLEEISQLAEEIDINKFLNQCVFLFIFAIIFVVVDYVGGFETVSLGVDSHSPMFGWALWLCGLGYTCY